MRSPSSTLLLFALTALMLSACGGGDAQPSAVATPAPAPGADPAPSTDPVPEPAAGSAVLLAGSASEPGCVDGPAATARFISPQGIALDDAGHLYVADFGCNAIRKISPNGTVSTFLGLLGVSGDVQGEGNLVRLGQPAGLHLNASTGILYAVDRAFSRVVAVNLQTRLTTSIAGKGAARGLEDDSTPNGNDINGKPLRNQGEMGFNFPNQLAACLDGLLCVADNGNNTVQIIDPSGNPTFQVTTLITGNVQGLLSADRFNGNTLDKRVWLSIGSSGIRLTQDISIGGSTVELGGASGTGSLDGIGKQARFDTPRGLARGAGSVMLAVEKSRIRKIDLDTLDISTALTNADALGGTPQQIVAAPDGKTYYYTAAFGVVKAALP